MTRDGDTETMEETIKKHIEKLLEVSNRKKTIIFLGMALFSTERNHYDIKRKQKNGCAQLLFRLVY